MHKSFWTKARRVLKRLYKAELDIKVRSNPMRNRLSAYYAADKARARERAEGLYAADAMDDAGLVTLYTPCYCDSNSLCQLDCGC